jgi:hypothetical protein
MSDNPVVNFVGQQDWLEPLAEKSDALVKSALDSVGEASDAAKEVLVNSRLLGHTRHPTITDVPFGSWTVTLVSDLLETAGKSEYAKATDASLAVGLVASLMAAAGGLADLSETRGQTDRQLGMMHGLLHGVTMLLYGGSLAARQSDKRKLGRALSFLGYGTLIGATYLANELRQKRAAESA